LFRGGGSILNDRQGVKSRRSLPGGVEKFERNVVRPARSAFAYFGGVTATIRVDNLCEAVIDAAIYDRKSIRSTPVCSSITA